MKITCQKIDAESLRFQIGSEELKLDFKTAKSDSWLRIGNSDVQVVFIQEDHSTYLTPRFEPNSIYTSFDTEKISAVFATDPQGQIALFLPFEELKTLQVEWTMPLETPGDQHLYRGVELLLGKINSKWAGQAAIKVTADDNNEETALAIILLRLALPHHCISFSSAKKPAKAIKFLMRSLKMGIEAQQKLVPIPEKDIQKLTPSQVLQGLKKTERQKIWRFLDSQSTITEPFKR